MTEQQAASRLTTDAELDDLELEWAREVYHPEDSTGNLLRTARIERVFTEEGFTVRGIEISPHRPPVWVIRLRTRVDSNLDKEQLFLYVRDLLKGIEIPLRKADLLVRRSGPRIIVSFIETPFVSKRKKSEELRRLLSLLP